LRLHKPWPKKEPLLRRERRHSWPKPRGTTISQLPRRRLRRLPRRRRRRKRPRMPLLRPLRRPHKPKCSLLLTVLLLILT